MSHFIVAIITKEPKKYHEQMAPFQENNMEDCPKEFLEFVDETEKYKKAWQTKSTTKVKLPNGKYISEYDDRLRVRITKEQYEKYREKSKYNLGSSGWGDNATYYKYDPKVVKGTVVKVPYKKLYKTLKGYVTHCEGSGLWDKKKKAYGWWQNPNAKWDSYSLCAKGNYGRWQNPTVEEAFVKVKDYKLYTDRNELIKEFDDKLKQVESGELPEILFNLNYGKYKDAEDYADKRKIDAPWAFVLDKHWTERGEMGWWAISDATDESEDAFVKLFEKVMTDPKYQDYYIGFVNCHI